MKKEKSMDKRKGWGFIIKVILSLMIFSIIISALYSTYIETEPLGNVAVIPVKGMIVVDRISSFGVSYASSEEIVDFIEDAEDRSDIKAIVIDINSPGGSPVASAEISQAIKDCEKPTIAVIREVGASGGYWIASSADYVISHELSITGSIGVIGSYIEYAGLLDRFNMSYQQLVSGERKDMGIPARKLTSEERYIIQKKLDIIHDSFIEAVAENRGLEKDYVIEIANGEYYIGKEALDIGLVDELGGKKEAEEFLKEMLNATDVSFAEYSSDPTLLDLLSGVFSEQSFFVGKGIGDSLISSKQEGIVIRT